MKRSTLLQAAILLAGFSLSLLANLANAQQARLYFFTSPNCGPCRDMYPVIEKLKNEGFKVSKVDASVQPKWVEHYNVTHFPTCIIVAGNKIYGKSSGYISVERLKAAMTKSEQLAAGESQVVQPASLARNSRLNQQSQPLQRQPTPAAQVPRQSLASAGASSAPFKKLAYQATVRLRVEDAEGISHGTGTIIDVRDGHALVLTCGHLFRDSRGTGDIQIDYGFDQQVKRSKGTLVKCDWNEKDVALVTMRIARNIQPIRLAPASYNAQKGEAVFSVGCSHGQNPTIKDCQVIRVAMYGLANSTSQSKAKKIDTTVRPVDGRSGGGLFTADGRLIGVCNAMATEVDEGIYSSVENAFWQLRSAGLQHIKPAGSRPQRIASSAPSSAPSSDSSVRVSSNGARVWTIQLRSPDGQTYTVTNPSRELIQKIATESGQSHRTARSIQPADMPDVRQFQSSEPQPRFRAQSPY